MIVENMNRNISVLLLAFCSVVVLTTAHARTPKAAGNDTIVKLEMHLSAMGVESEGFPNVDVVIDLKADTGNGSKWYFEPFFQPEKYSFSKADIKKVLGMIDTADLDRIKRERVTTRRTATDQPTATTIITYTSGRKLVLDDYGMVCTGPMRDIYLLVFRYRSEPIDTRKK